MGVTFNAYYARNPRCVDRHDGVCRQSPAARVGNAEGGDYDAQALADLRATFEGAPFGELQALLMGLHDCQQPKSEPAPQAAAPDPRDHELNQRSFRYRGNWAQNIVVWLKDRSGIAI